MPTPATALAWALRTPYQFVFHHDYSDQELKDVIVELVRRAHKARMPAA